MQATLILMPYDRVQSESHPVLFRTTTLSWSRLTVTFLLFTPFSPVPFPTAAGNQCGAEASAYWWGAEVWICLPTAGQWGSEAGLCRQRHCYSGFHWLLKANMPAWSECLPSLSHLFSNKTFFFICAAEVIHSFECLKFYILKYFAMTRHITWIPKFKIYVYLWIS